MVHGSMSQRGALLFAAMCLIWGVPYLLIKVAVDDMSPAVLVLGRTLIAAALLLPLAIARRELRPLLPFWLPLAAFAAVEIAIPWVLLGAAETKVSSSLTAGKVWVEMMQALIERNRWEPTPWPVPEGVTVTRVRNVGNTRTGQGEREEVFLPGQEGGGTLEMDWKRPD